MKSLKNGALGLALAFTIPAIASAHAQQPKRLTRADLFVDLNDYVGNRVLVVDGVVVGAENNRAHLRTPGAIFSLRLNDADRATVRFFLTNCVEFTSVPTCKLQLLVTPTNERGSLGPLLTFPKIADK